MMGFQHLFLLRTELLLKFVHLCRVKKADHKWTVQALSRAFEAIWISVSKT